MKKLMFPAVLAIALTTSGVAFAASATDVENEDLYAESSSFTVPYDQSTPQRIASQSDQRLDLASQRANMNGMNRLRQETMSSPMETDNSLDDRFFGEYGPE